MMKLHPILFTLVAGSALAQGHDAPLGRWLTESGNLEVEIAPCAEPPAGTLCGKVVRVLANRSMSAPGQEMQPADTRPALGMTLLSGLTASGEGEYRGTIYNRENAKHYSVKLTPVEPAQLLVRGYVGLPLFGKTQVWRRPLPEVAAEAASGATR
ncbi:MAG TPA: DUF2147 domain-containing protein [Rhizobacter sp.]|nr:DUF2147 domain-containing protein [Rhizobacter sp.]